ncbi:autotransporter assembly complex protein TamA [Aromatoleum toluclasticum]|uniref:autotransporter assembly complex protein TamA n=1 Tax=Aromatoleum toluclasticum TaxID=92003 RepID=UPI001D17EA12|nr:autotransporter assembly complex family protein [Aromatoleum toluclasticum]MCC4115196.1 autotransporter assembly complex protein TamA [Aromatoleum toluclasticum]
MSVRRVRASGARVLAALCLAVLSPLAAAQQPLRVQLDAPESVRPLLERHLRILNRSDQILPAERADRIALARRARREAAELLATEGYFSPELRLEREDEGDWKLTVVPGTPAKVVAVEVQFEGALGGQGEALAARRTQLRNAWPLAAGQVFRQSAWDDAKRRLLDDVASRDYAAARIADSRAEVDPEAATVRLVVTVDSGPPFFLGPIEVAGLKNLPADLVERFNRLQPGRPFNQDELLALQGTLQNVPQFASVVVDVERDPALAAAVPVRVQVSEARSRQLGFGTGYSSNTGFRGEVSWRDVNLFGRGWELASALRVEQLRQSLFADVFLPPAPGGYRDSVGAAAERSTVEGLTLTTQAVGVARTNTRAIAGGTIDTRLALRLQQEERKLDGGDTTRRKALTLNWAWTRRAVDDVLDPRRGDVMQLEIGGGSRALLSDQNFVRLYGRYVRYVPVVARDVLILRAEGGATLAKSRDGVPQDFLFRTGGTQTVRGYAYQSLGVQDADAIVGGRYLATASAEYVHWFRPQWGAAAFFDAGDAADDRGIFEWEKGYGVGARWKSPAGPLALDLAWGQAERRMRLHFGIAIAF